MAINGLSIKLLIDTKAQKVCFAEAGYDVVEFLSCLLCLPLSTIINLSPTVAPAMLSPLQKLLDVPLNVNTSVFTCSGKTDSHHGTHITCGYFSAIKGSICPSCFRSMNKEMPDVKDNGFGFAVGTTAYTVSDGLSITPASSVSSITLLAQCGVKDLSTLEHRTVKIGKEEALEIHLASLKSKTVLTDVFLPKKKSSLQEGSCCLVTHACAVFLGEPHVQITTDHLLRRVVSSYNLRVKATAWNGSVRAVLRTKKL